jgi:signal transduction histidine kinase
MIGETSFSLSKIGDSHFYIALIRDITERIEAEKKLKELNNELERKIEERTEKLKEINSELQQFAYVVSHDLKAPLRGISQIAYWLKNDYLDKLDTDGVDLLEMLIQRVNILDELIAGILQYSRVGRTEADKELIDLTELLDEVYTFFSTSENFELKYQLENNFIIAHKVRLEQVLQNLIDNAIRYNDKEKTIVSVESYDMGDSWKIIVRDNGPGIAKKYHDKVFQIFQTLQPKDSQSTGIGLALIKKIIEMYNGSIFIDSEVGKGTAFIINIPKS